MARGPRSPGQAIDGLPIGRRTKQALVANPVNADRYVLVRDKIRPPSDDDVSALAALYEIGARYHVARKALCEALESANRWLVALFGALDGEAVIPGAATEGERRVAVRELMSSAIQLEAAATAMQGLPGIAAVACAAREAADALASAAGAALVPCANLTSDAALEVKLGTYSDCREALEQLEPRPPRPRRIRDVIIAADPVSPETRLRVSLCDETDPWAPGAVGLESVVRLTAPWSSVAWLAWCAAGRGDSWQSTWDRWPALDRYSLKTIGGARGVTGNAVGESRR